jgi:hypothetical protein
MPFKYDERLIIRIDKPLKLLLQEHAERHGLSAAAMLRKMISDYRKKRK